ncbi:hypothetical protein CIPAW_13G154400 [Carya illinoinensis]|uniref:glucan endo-1,3-beta-D-glucosidase n=1 Tax=Carya illinoinensis TaxID=32201 RepID=A0A8T1NT34_CARIL|nr:hypothetical protein CIPAW_13G154400 [Carya illinoinensis]
MRTKPLVAAILLQLRLLCGLQHVGVCYGGSGNADNLPPESEAVSLCKTQSIGKMGIYSPYPEILEPLRDFNIELIVGVPNDSLKDFADPSAATDWVKRNIKDYSSNVKFKYIYYGWKRSESNRSRSTAVDTNLLGVFDPPSAAAFSANAGPFMEPIIGFLVSTGAPLLANIYPYFRVKYNHQPVPYALFTATDVVVQDGKLEYRNLFDALMDALYSVIEKTNGKSLDIVVSGSGWPTAGGAVETIENAGTYRNLEQKTTNHVKVGTPKRPGKTIEIYLFGPFDENLKEEEIEKHFGLFYPNKQAKYTISFS